MQMCRLLQTSMQKMHSNGDYIRRKSDMKRILSCFFALIFALTLLCPCMAADVPEIQQVWYEGITIVGRNLYGKCEYTSGEKGTDTAAFRWLRSDSKNGEYTAIPGATGQVYMLTEDDAGMYIKVEATPRNANGSGTAVLTEGYPVYAESNPTVSGVELHGSGKSREQLWVDYHYSDANGEPERNTFYRWQASDDNTNFRYIDNASEQSFIPDDNYIGKYVRASVRADKLGSTAESASGAGPISDEVFSDSVLICAKPYADGVGILVGEKYTGSYSYHSPDNTAQGTSEFVWEASESKDGEYTQISNSLSIDKITSAKDLYIKFSVIPVSKYGIKGDMQTSEPILTAGTKTEDSNSVTTAACNADKTLLLKLSEPQYVGGIVINIKSSAKDMEVTSTVFNVAKTAADGGYVFVFMPKDNNAVYINGTFAECKAENNKSVSIEDVSMLEYGNNCSYTASDSPVSFAAASKSGEPVSVDFDIDKSKKEIYNVEPFISVKSFVGAIGTDYETKVLTASGEAAAEGMLINDSMTVEFTKANGDTEIYTIRTDKYTSLNLKPPESAEDGSVLWSNNGSESFSNGIGNVANVYTGTSNGGKTMYKINGGYGFSYSGGEDNGNIGVRTTYKAALDTKKMSAGGKTVYEMTIKPKAIGRYVTHFRWIIDENGTFKADQDIFGSSKTSGITFAENGKIYLGGGDPQRDSFSAMTYLCEWQPDTEYKVQIVTETARGADVLKVEGVYINGIRYAENIERVLLSSAYKIYSLAEVDYYFLAYNNAAYDVNISDIKCYTANNFAPYAYLPENYQTDKIELYAYDKLAGKPTVKTGLKTGRKLTDEFEKINICAAVKDFAGNTVSENAVLTDEMILYLSSSDGRKTQQYSISFLSDYGKLTHDKDEFQRTVHHYSDNSDLMQMIAAAYDIRGQLVDCKMSEKKILSGYETGTLIATLNNSGAYTTKIFLIDPNSLKPYIDAITINDGSYEQTNTTNFD